MESNDINKDNHSKDINYNSANDINDNINENPYIKDNNIEFILMEKDKEIINLSHEIKTLNSNIESLLNAIKNKDLEISLLKADINTFNNDKMIFEEEKVKYQKEICDLNKIIEEKSSKIEEIISNNNISNEKLNNILLSKNNDYNKLNNEYYKLQNDFNLLNNKLILKDNTLNKLENSIYNNKEKNNKIILLNKEIKEKNELIKDLQVKLVNINNVLVLSKSYNDEKFKKNNDIGGGQQNDIFSFFIEKIQNLLVFLEKDKNFEFPDKHLEKMVEIKEGFVFYDLLEQNLLMLKNKISNKYNEIITQNNEYKKIINKQENQIKTLILDLEETKKLVNNQNNQKDQIINKLNKKIAKSYEEISKLNNKIPETTKGESGQISQNQFNQFYRNVLSKVNKTYLKEFNILNYKNISFFTTDEKSKNIINIIDCMNNKINQLYNFVKEYENYKNKVNRIINQNLSRTNEQNNEILELKNTIKELNDLLEQCKIYLKQSRKENDLLKTRNLNLEKNINLISKNNAMMISRTNKDNLLKNIISNNYPSLEELKYSN